MTSGQIVIAPSHWTKNFMNSSFLCHFNFCFFSKGISGHIEEASRRWTKMSRFFLSNFTTALHNFRLQIQEILGLTDNPQMVCAMMPSLNNGFCLKRFLKSSKSLPWSILFQNGRIIISPLTQLQNHWSWGTSIVGCTPISHEYS